MFSNTGAEDGGGRLHCDHGGTGRGSKPENREMIYDVVFRWSLGQNDKIMVFLDSLFGKGTSEIIT